MHKIQRRPPSDGGWRCGSVGPVDNHVHCKIVETCFICRCWKKKLSSWTAVALTTLKMPAAFSFNTSGQSFVFFFFILLFCVYELFVSFFKAVFVEHSAAHLERPLPNFVKGYPRTLNSFWFSRRLVSFLCRFSLYNKHTHTYLQIHTYIYSHIFWPYNLEATSVNECHLFYALNSLSVVNF